MVAVGVLEGMKMPSLSLGPGTVLGERGDAPWGQTRYILRVPALYFSTDENRPASSPRPDSLLLLCSQR